MLGKFPRNVLMCSVFSLCLACTDPGEKTKIGAAAGGLAGAGLGAIVGNQVGNTGEGLVLGAAAGAGAGALVGNVMDQQDTRINTQDEVLQKQERMLATQSGEIEELRRMGHDSVSFKGQLHNSLSRGSGKNEALASYNWPSRPTSARQPQGFSQQGFSQPTQINRQPVMAGSLGATRGNMPEPLPRQMAANVNERSIVAENYPPPVRHQAFGGEPLVRGETNSQVSQPTRINNDSWQRPEVRGQAAPEINSVEVNAAVPSVEQNSFEPVKMQPALGAIVEDVAQANQPVAASMRIAGAGLESPECQQAQDEARSASAASDPADKLFHYRRALRLCPDNSDYHNGLGEVYLSLNRSEDAKFEFQESLRLNPGHSEAKANLSKVR